MLKVRTSLRFPFRALLLLVLISVTAGGCVLDDSPAPEPPIRQPACVNLPPPPEPFFEWKTLFPRYYDAAICLNPNDPNEIVHFRYNFQQRSDTIFRYDLQTSQRRVLVHSLNATFIEWGSSDWILVDVPGIWKVRASGEGLSHVDLPGIPSRPRWNPAGDRFAVFLNLGSAASGYYVVDLEGNRLDTLTTIKVHDWYAEDSILGVAFAPGTTEEGIYLYSLSSGEREFLLPVPLEVDDGWNGAFQLRMFSDHDRIAVLTGNGLWVVSAKRRTVKRLAWSCDNRRMMSMRVHPNGRYLYVEENGFELVDSVTVRNVYTVLRMDAETGERLDTLLYSAPD